MFKCFATTEKSCEGCILFWQGLIEHYHIIAKIKSS